MVINENRHGKQAPYVRWCEQTFTVEEKIDWRLLLSVDTLLVLRWVNACSSFPFTGSHPARTTLYATSHGIALEWCPVWRLVSSSGLLECGVKGSLKMSVTVVVAFSCLMYLPGLIHRLGERSYGGKCRYMEKEECIVVSFLRTAEPVTRFLANNGVKKQVLQDWALGTVYNIVITWVWRLRTVLSTWFLVVDAT